MEFTLALVSLRRESMSEGVLACGGRGESTPLTPSAGGSITLLFDCLGLSLVPSGALALLFLFLIVH